MIQFLLHPLLVVALCLACALLLGPRPWFQLSRRRALWALTLILLLVGLAGPSLSAAGHMIFHDEATVVSIAAAELHGQPLYHAPAAPERYSVLYGPATYWVYQPPMLLHIRDLRFYQLWVILPLLLSAVLLTIMVRRAGSRPGMVFALLPYASTVLIYSASEWAMKGDAWLLLFSTLQLCAAVFLPGAAAIAGVAVGGALLVDTKLTTVFLALLPAAILLQRLGRKQAYAAAGVMLVLAGVPFLLPGISAANFLFWLTASGHHGIAAGAALSNLGHLLFLFAPALALLAWLLHVRRAETLQLLRQRSLLLLLTVLAFLTADLTGAKLGAGPWHCAPFAPFIVWCSASLYRRATAAGQPVFAGRLFQALAATIVLSELLLALVASMTSLVTHLQLHIRHHPAVHAVANSLVAEDIASIAASYPHDTIAMGYGSDASYEITWQRPLLVLLGNRYDIDADAMNEDGLSGVPMPQGTLDALRSCRTNMYLIPSGDPPFSMESLYHSAGARAPRDLFPASFQQEFLHDYHHTGSSRYFDLWTCTQPGRLAQTR